MVFARAGRGEVADQRGAHQRGEDRRGAETEADTERLTAGERDAFHLIATGLTNAEIAQCLHLTETTVKTHSTRILAKP
ncbi:response regulator transcription factor [Streptomyces sp. NPDC001123]